MRILIATGLSPLDVGGTAQYASNMARELNLMGHNAWIVGYGRVEKNLPIGFRHLYFLLKTIPKAFYSDRIIALDTFSVGIPALWASWILRKKIIVRVGGDFLWESYVNRTGEMITLPEFYKKAQKVRELIKNDLLRALKEVDIILTPTMPVLPFKFGENDDDPLKMWLADAYTVTLNPSGLPGLSVNAGWSKDGLPVGMQLIGPHFREDLLLNFGHKYICNDKYF